MVEDVHSLQKNRYNISPFSCHLVDSHQPEHPSNAIRQPPHLYRQNNGRLEDEVDPTASASSFATVPNPSFRFPSLSVPAPVLIKCKKPILSCHLVDSQQPENLSNADRQPPHLCRQNNGRLEDEAHPTASASEVATAPILRSDL